MDLIVKPSQIPHAGMGLYTGEPITEGTLIVEYTGEITNWASVKGDWENVYIYYVTEDFVIDAKDYPESYGRYANDATGLTHTKKVSNNSEFINIEGKIYIKALRNISAGEEILVAYGDDYWETIRRNKA